MNSKETSGWLKQGSFVVVVMCYSWIVRMVECETVEKSKGRNNETMRIIRTMEGERRDKRW